MQSNSESSRRKFLAALGIAPMLFGQEKEPFTITDNVNLVLLEVSVKDSAGGYVTGLTKENFAVFDSGHPVPITQFSKADAPITVGLILDDSGSMRTKRPSVVIAGLQFAHESNAQDEFFVVNFNDHVVPGLPNHMAFTDKTGPLHEALYMGEPAGLTKLYDAIAYGLRHLENGHHDQRTLIVVSDGGDTASHLSLNDVMRLIEESRATIYTVGLMDPDNNDLKPHILKRIANVSGGEYFQPENIENVMSVLKKIAQDIRNRYTVGFTPDVTATTKVNHSIKVTASSNGRNLVVRARSSYSVAPFTGNPSTSL